MGTENICVSSTGLKHKCSLSPFSARARALAALHGGGSGIANVRSRIALVGAGDGVLPAGIVDDDGGEAWVASPRRTYAGYAGEEAARHFPRFRAVAGRTSAGVDRWLAHAGIDRAVTLNQWLVSTNLYPALASVNLPALVAEARERWPTHALWWRSLNDVQHADWLQALDALGFRRIASRQVWLVDDAAVAARRHGDLRRDLKLLADGRFRRVADADIVATDYPRIAELYSLLYLRKYSRHNPDYPADVIRGWHRAGLLQLHGARADDGRLAAIAGILRFDGIATTPMVGYDTTRPQREALYRRLTAEVFAAAIDRGFRLNLSAGAAAFKRTRGGRPAIEYSVVDARHRPPPARRAVAMLSAMTQRIGVPLMRRFAL
jgi:hypothetical protein